MPAPIDLSVWGSLYALQKADDDGQVMTPREADVDFGVGYGITTLLAVAFAVLGWLVMYGAVDEQGNPVTLAQGGVGFSQQFVNMYTQSLGDWSFGLVAFVAIATMVSTSVTCIDGYPRAVTATLQTIRRKDAIGDDAAANNQIQPWSLVPALLIMTGAALLIVWLLIGNLLQMLQVAMIIAACTRYFCLAEYSFDFRWAYAAALSPSEMGYVVGLVGLSGVAGISCAVCGVCNWLRYIGALGYSVAPSKSIFMSS